MDDNLHSPERRLIELRMDLAELEDRIGQVSKATPVDELRLRRLRKLRQGVRAQILGLEAELDPPEPA